MNIRIPDQRIQIFIFFVISMVLRSDAADSIVEALAKLTRDHGNNIVVDVDLGSFLPSEEVRAKIKIHNEDDRPFEFKKIHRSCGCLSAAMETMTLPAKGSETMQVTIQPIAAEFAASIKRDITLDYYEDGALQQFMIRLHYKRKGLMTLGQTLAFVDKPTHGKQVNVLVPMIVEDPVKLEDIDIEASTEVAKALVVQRGDKHFLSVTVDKADEMSSDPVVIDVAEHLIGQHSRLTLVFRDAPELEISPSILTLKAVDGPKREWSGILLIKSHTGDVKKNGSEAPAEPINPAGLQAACILDGYRVESKVIGISKTLAKLKLTVVEDEDSRTSATRPPTNATISVSGLGLRAERSVQVVFFPVSSL